MSQPDYFEWYSPMGGLPLVFGPRPFVLRNFSNLGNTLCIPQLSKGPFQVGERLLNVDIAGRVLTLTLRLVADSLAELSSLRRTLSRVMTMESTRGHEAPGMGILRYYRQGHETLSLLCVPRESPQYSELVGTYAVDADLELYAPDPYWQAISDSSATILGVGGFEWPIELPIELESFAVKAEINNKGDVLTPIRALVFGELETFRLINETTGEELEVMGSILADAYIEVNTAFGDKALTYVDPNGNRTDVMQRLVLGSTFWQLRQGTNVVRFEAHVNVSGRVVLYWRERVSGV